MIYAAVRLRGITGINYRAADTLKHLKLHRANSCVIVPESALGMLEAAGSYITYGEADEKTLELLVSKRSKLGREAIKDIIEGRLRPVFRLPPPSKGYKSIKKPFPKGDVGYRGAKINELIMRMV